MAKKNRFIDQATLQALVRFGPELSGLKALQRNAEGTYTQTTKGARGAARYITSVADQARPQVKQDWTQIGLSLARSAHDTLGSNMPAASAGNSAIQNAILAEQSGAQSRLSEGQANELASLRSTKIQAAQGSAWAETSARNDLVKTLADIFHRRQDIANEKGAYIASTAQDLKQAAKQEADRIAMNNADNSQSERNSLRSAGIDPKTGKPIPGGKLDPKAPGNKKKGARATGTQIGSAQDEVQRLLPMIRQQSARGRTRQEIATVLLNGFKGQPVYQTVNGKQQRVLNPDGTQKTTGTIDPAKSPLLLSAALDQVFGGYVTNQTRGKLHRRGIYLTDLGLTRYGDYRRKRNTISRPANTPGPNGQYRPT